MHAQCPQRPEEDPVILGTGVTLAVSHLVSAGNQPGSSTGANGALNP